MGKISFKERRQIVLDVKDCGLPRESAREFFGSSDRSKVGGYLFQTVLWGGAAFGSISSLLTLADIVPSPSQTVAGLLNYSLPVGAPQALDLFVLINAAMATCCITIANYSTKYDRNSLNKTAENERARRLGEQLPHDELFYNPQKLISSL